METLASPQRERLVAPGQTWADRFCAPNCQGLRSAKFCHHLTEEKDSLEEHWLELGEVLG